MSPPKRQRRRVPKAPPRQPRLVLEPSYLAYKAERKRLGL